MNQFNGNQTSASSQREEFDWLGGQQVLKKATALWSFGIMVPTEFGSTFQYSPEWLWIYKATDGRSDTIKNWDVRRENKMMLQG
jgi:hypothetical protein